VLQQLVFLGAFLELWKATISFIVSARLLVCLRGRTQLPLDRFSLNLMF